MIYKNDRSITKLNSKDLYGALYAHYNIIANRAYCCTTITTMKTISCVEFRRFVHYCIERANDGCSTLTVRCRHPFILSRLFHYFGVVYAVIKP